MPHRAWPLAAILAFATLAQAERPPRDFEKLWGKEIASIEKRDEEQKPKEGGVVFVGSSSIRLWDLKKSFPEMELVNHGFGGSTIADSIHYFDRLVLRLKPKTIVMYAGDNDLANGLSPQEVHADFVIFSRLVREKLPGAKLLFFPTKPSPSRVKLIDKQKEANRLIRETIEQDTKHFVYLDTFMPMLDSAGLPRPELFVKDMLHMNEQGYEIWSKVLEPHLK